jgi:arylsulfatase A-like enzyme
MKLALTFLTFLCCSAVAAQPNLIIILADDLGYSDPGCFGGEIATPSLDRLATEGVRLARFQNGGMCVVSRASMLTGKWWPRALPGFAKTRLISEQLHDAGYRTGLVGKWHLDGNPMDRGFDTFFGFLAGFADHFSGAPSYRDGRAPFTKFAADYYSTDAFTDRASVFVKDESTKPFFLYLSYQAPHNPLQAPAADIAKYRGKYMLGWQAVRDARFLRQKEMGIVAADATLPEPPKNLPAWDSLTDAQRDLEDLRMSVYAAMVERMDAGIGRLVEALKQSGKADNTLILFMSDNGPDSFSVVDTAMLQRGLLPGDPKSNWQLGTGWAYANATPWRLYKISQHGGGITSGAIAWWAGAAGKPGRIENSRVHMVDVLPTFLEAASAKPDGAPAGESFLPLVKGDAWKRKSPLFFQYMDNRAIRTDEWTLAEVDGAGWELFRAESDPLEKTNVAAENAGIVAALDAQWLAWWRSESGKRDYTPESTNGSPHFKPQGDRGSGVLYTPSAMPPALSTRYPNFK